MTEQFYHSLLSYISTNERQHLFSTLQKGKWKFNGFRAIKDVPLPIIARTIAKNEQSFYRILKGNYSTDFSDNADAINSFLPDTAISCLLFLSEADGLDEAVLTPLLSKKEESPVQVEHPEKNTKRQKKEDTFRTKYLQTYKDLKQAEALYQACQIENKKLHTLLLEKEQQLIEARAELEACQNNSFQTISILENRISELNILLSSRTKDEYGKKLSVLVLGESQVIAGVTTLKYDDISQLQEIIDDYSEVLFVANDMPFSIKRRLYRTIGVTDKARAFSSFTELIDYIKKGSQK